MLCALYGERMEKREGGLERETDTERERRRDGGREVGGLVYGQAGRQAGRLGGSGSAAGGEIMGADEPRVETLMLPGALTNTPTPIEHALSYRKPIQGAPLARRPVSKGGKGRQDGRTGEDGGL